MRRFHESAGGRAAFKEFTILSGEIMHRQDETPQRFTERRERVLDPRPTRGQRMSGHSAVEFEFTELRGENLLADTGQRFAELAMAAASSEELAKDEHLPFAGDDRQQALDFTLHGLVVHLEAGTQKYLIVQWKNRCILSQDDEDTKCC